LVSEVSGFNISVEIDLSTSNGINITEDTLLSGSGRGNLGSSEVEDGSVSNTSCGDNLKGNLRNCRSLGGEDH
jgi:hypothetical protein